MIFSKSFGYALRGILYIAFFHAEQRNIPVDEIAGELGVPRHFMSKVLKQLVKANLLLSAKGPSGGFSLHPAALATPVLDIVKQVDGLRTFQHCVLRFEHCDAVNPCPLHQNMEVLKNTLTVLLNNTTIADLLKDDKSQFISGLSANGKGVATKKNTYDRF